jgi:hypothetical protein
MPTPIGVFFPSPFSSIYNEPHIADHFKPGIPSASAAKALLVSLKETTITDVAGYARDKFKTWDTISGTCSTRSSAPSSSISYCFEANRWIGHREYVLQRDGTNVTVNAACTATSGTWVSPYDGGIWTAASEVDIDHMVPLKDAWDVRTP